MYANDGRGSTLSLEVSRLVADTAQAQSARVFVRSQMGAQRIVSFIGSEVASINGRGSFEEAQSFIDWLFLPVVPRLPFMNVKSLDGNPMVILPCCHFTTYGSGVGRALFHGRFHNTAGHVAARDAHNASHHTTTTPHGASCPCLCCAHCSTLCTTGRIEPGRLRGKIDFERPERAHRHLAHGLI